MYVVHILKLKEKVTCFVFAYNKQTFQLLHSHKVSASEIFVILKHGAIL